MHESWQELLDWVWHEKGNTDNSYYFNIRNSILYYTFTNDPTHYKHFWYSVDTSRLCTLPNEYTKLHRRTPFIGPIQPEPSAVIKKIREMAKRREVSYV